MKCPHCKKQLVYEVKMISPFEILKYKKGVLGIMPGPVANSYGTELHKNRELIVEFINDMGKEGWEMIGAFNYESIPYKGAIVFRRAITGEEELEEMSQAIDKPVKKEKISTIIKRNREKKVKAMTRNDLPKTNPMQKNVKVDESDKKNLNDMFNDALQGVRPEEPPGDKIEEWKERENRLMMEKEGQESENVEELNREMKKRMKDDGKNVATEITVGNLEAKFEETHPGKHAIWQGSETRAYKNWKSEYLRGLSKRVPTKVEKKQED